MLTCICFNMHCRLVLIWVEFVLNRVNMISKEISLCFTQELRMRPHLVMLKKVCLEQIIAARIRRMGQGNVFTFLSVHTRGIPQSQVLSQVLSRGGTPVLARRVPQSYPGAGYPSYAWGVPQDRGTSLAGTGGMPQLVLLGYPLAGTGVCPSTGTGVPSRTAYTVGGTPLAVSRSRDFLVSIGSNSLLNPTATLSTWKEKKNMLWSFIRIRHSKVCGPTSEHYSHLLCRPFPT